MADYEKRGYLLENFRLFHLRSDKGEQIDYHYHEFCKVLLLVSGSGTYFIDGQRYMLQPGDAVLIGSRSVHRPEIDSGIPYERVILYISPDYLQRESTADCNLLSVFSGAYGHVLRLKESQRRRLFDIAASLERELSGNAFGREILSNTLMLRLLVEIGRDLTHRENHRPGPILPKDPRIRDMLHYIDENLTEELDVEKLADTFFISKYHMMRLFRRETGSTVHTYLTQKRLILARQLIDNGMRATEACYQCGFHSYSSFTRAYGKHFGTTPTGRADLSYAREEGFE